MNRNIAITGIFITAATIAIGAFGAHGLKGLVSPEAVDTFETGVRYQMYHALALVILGYVSGPNRLKRIVATFFIIGILLFSGSIYLLSLNEVLPFDAGKIGFVTPIGGLVFIIGWLRWGYGLFR